MISVSSRLLVGTVVVLAACKGSTGTQGVPGPQGDTGTAGTPVVVAAVDPGGACSMGGASFTSGSVTAYACNGLAGPKGERGDGVVVGTLAPGDLRCPDGGALFSSGGLEAYACTGPKGDKGTPGSDGLSVTAVSLAPGDDPACPYGGTRFTTASGPAYACNGAPDAGCPVPGAILCGGQCRNVLADPDNCGACGTRCDSRLCSNGSCAKVMFVTSSYFDGGDLGGVTGADGKCQTFATSAGLLGTYRAWLASGSSYSPAQSWRRETVPYVNRAGVIVANGWSELVSGTLAHAVALDESGSPATHTYWSGTTAQGFPSGFDCGGWTSAAYGYVPYGSPASVTVLSSGGGTLQDGGKSCVAGVGFGALLCVEQ